MTSPARACIWFTTELPRSSRSPESSCGRQACTTGDSKAPSTERAKSSAPAGSTPPAARKKGSASSTARPEAASIPAISLRLSQRSASAPPRGESSTVGAIASASIPANTPAEPVSSSTYIDSANLSA